MRKSRRILLITLLIAMLVVVSWLLLSQPSEPVYQGKPLSFWCDQYAPSYTPGAHSQKQAEIAIRTIGTNAIPTFLRMLQVKDSKFKLKLLQLASKQHVVNIRWKSAEFWHYLARLGFSVLGSDGKSAIPALLVIFNKPSSDPYDSERGNIADIFASMGPAAADAVPQLVQGTTDTSVHIRWKAVWALGQIHTRPGLAVPALTRALLDPDYEVRTDAAQSLAAFESDAKSAVPELIKALADPASRVRIAAATALKKIDPEAAAKAGVK